MARFEWPLLCEGICPGWLRSAKLGFHDVKGVALSDVPRQHGGMRRAKTEPIVGPKHVLCTVELLRWKVLSGARTLTTLLTF